MPRLIIGFTVVLIALFGGYFFYQNYQSRAKTENVALGESPLPLSSKAPVTQEIRVIEIEAGSFYYNPNEIMVNLGETVKIVMKSKDMMHNFNIDELDVHLPITRAGETNSVEFTANKAGEFEYYCSMSGHRQKGQFGKLIVQ